jgi:hypothetical protein
MHFDSPIPSLSVDVPPVAHPDFDPDVAVTKLAELDEALTDDIVTGPLAAFVRASSSRTNVADQRITRVAAFYSALCGLETNAI